MDQAQKEKIIQTIISREKLRGLSRIKRLFVAPWRTLPFYIVASLTRLHTFKMSFKTLWGDTMTCYMPEGNTFLYYGYCEANLTNFLLKNLKVGQTFIDVGAHVGFYTMLASRLVGNTGFVHSFEPTPWTFELLNKNSKSVSSDNKLSGGPKNITTNNCAVSDTAGEFEFFDYGPGFGAYNTSDKDGTPTLNKNKKLIKVSTINLDEYCNKHSIKPDFVKLDAEGAEHLILKGMEQILSSHRPLISLEVAGDKQWEDNRRKSFDILSKNEYTPFEMSVDGTASVHKIKEQYGYDNLIFIPKEKVSQIVH